MEITVTMLGGTSHTLTVSPQDTVGSLKNLIQKKLRVPLQDQKLVFVSGQNTTLSDDSKTVSEYGLQSGSQVSLLVTQPATIQVFLKNDKGTSSVYDIKPDETVTDFTQKVGSREKVPVSQLYLVHEGKQMTEGKLSDYDVKAGSTIYMCLRLRGG
ncbi:polyubiquitin-like [Siniperca chuatsi]|uniref:polyubiquitin-like n=1 Tax=Siniperca chuatsi TaxID=119488 RepID=UPI001CE1118E|nr:polyubiquitin-like [Siniperca chuatsi]